MNLVGPFPGNAALTEAPGKAGAPGNVMTAPHRAWLSRVGIALANTGANGPSSSRPTQNLYIGMPFYDSTLGSMIFVKSLNPTVWTSAIPAPVAGVPQTLFYLLNFQPAATQAGDVQLYNVLGNIPGIWVPLNLLYRQISSTPMTGSNQILRLFEGPGKTGQQISGGDFGTIAAGNSPGAGSVFEDNAIVVAINTGSNQPYYPSSTSQTLYASMSAAGLGGSGAYDIFVQGVVLPFGP